MKITDKYIRSLQHSAVPNGSGQIVSNRDVVHYPHPARLAPVISGGRIKGDVL
jgi:hypothetical protein